MSFDWKKTLGILAPGIATALGGPLAGLATQAVASAFGLTEGATEEQIEEIVLRSDPKEYASLKQAEANFKLELKRLDVNLEELGVRDRESARTREVAAGGKLMGWLAVGIIGTFLGIVIYLVCFNTRPLRGEDAVFIGTLIGYISAKAEQVASYYFGSSSGSAGKSEALAAALLRRK